MLADGAFCARVRAAYEGDGDGDGSDAQAAAAAAGGGSSGSGNRAGIVDASSPSDVRPPTQGRGSSLF